MKTLSEKYTKVLLLCGILSSVIYIGTDLLASSLYEGYSYMSQQVSELSAIGAPTRGLMVAMSYVWTPLVIAFGLGVWLRSGPKRSLRLTGFVLITYAVIGLLWNFAPMHQRGTAELEADIIHIVFAGVQVIMILLFISFGSGADGKAFSIYSFLTIIALLVFGAWTATMASALAEGQPTPWMGIIERVNVYLSMIWVLVFAVILLVSEKRQVGSQ